METPDTDSRYRHPRFGGVALRVRGWEQRWEPCTYLIIDEDGEECELEEPGEGEWVDDIGGMVEVVMVGDDRVHVVDPDELEKIEDHEYCHDCGQIGCHSNTGEER